MNTTKRLGLSAAILLASGFATSAVFADEQLRTETVKFSDLKTDTPAGVQELYRRIHEAAKRVCDNNDPVMRLGSNACARKAEEQAIDKVNLPQLTAFYRDKTGKQPSLIAQR